MVFYAFSICSTVFSFFSLDVEFWHFLSSVCTLALHIYTFEASYFIFAVKGIERSFLMFNLFIWSFQVYVLKQILKNGPISLVFASGTGNTYPYFNSYPITLDA